MTADDPVGADAVGRSGPGGENALDPHLGPDFDRSALLVIDTQNDFLDDGSCPVAGTVAVLPAIARLLAAYRSAQLPIVHIVRLYAGDDVDLVRRASIRAGAAVVAPGSPGSQIAVSLRPPGAPELDPATLLAGEPQHLGPHEVVLWKPRWSAFYRTSLDAHLARLGVTTVVMAGCNFPNCPRASIYDASARDYRLVLATDSVSGLAERDLAEMRGIGVVDLDSPAIAQRLI